MEYSLLKFFHIVGVVLIGGGLIGLVCCVGFFRVLRLRTDLGAALVYALPVDLILGCSRTWWYALRQATRPFWNHVYNLANVGLVGTAGTRSERSSENQ
jgi:hypothetical protein